MMTDVTRPTTTARSLRVVRRAATNGRSSSTPVDGSAGRKWIGVWPSRDPIGERGGINLYGFVDNSPIVQVDPHGKVPFLIIKSINMANEVIDHFIDQSEANEKEKEWAKENRLCACSVLTWKESLLGEFERLGYNSRTAEEGKDEEHIGNLDNTVVNALIHCALTCSLASLPNCTVEQVRAFGVAHEEGTPGNRALLSNMDLYNNDRGLELATTEQSIATCISACEGKAKSNELKWWKDLHSWALNPNGVPSAANYTPGENGEIPGMEDEEDENP